MTQANLKQAVAERAIDYIDDDMIVGVGTGSTVNYFIEALAQKKHRIEAAVSSSKVSTDKLRALNIPVIDSNSVSKIDVYIDGADEVNPHRDLIKGGGAALTGEKILTAMSDKFVCIVDESKMVDVLGKFPLPVEVIPMARSFVARQILQLDGDPEYRQGLITDYGNVILDIHNLNIIEPAKLEQALNQIPGVVTNGLFTKNYKADIVLVGTEGGIKIIGE